MEKLSKNNSKKEILIAILLIIIGISILMIVQLENVNIISSILKDIINAIFSKMAVIFSIFMMILGFYKLLNHQTYTFKKIDYIRFFLFSFCAILIYGYINIDLILEKNYMSLDVIKKVISLSKEGFHIGILSYIITFFIAKFIGKIGVIILITALIMYSIFKYHLNLLKKIINNLKEYKNIHQVIKNLREEQEKILKYYKKEKKSDE